VPIFVIAVAAVVSRHWGALRESALVTATRFAFALVPIGFGMWLAHYSFHFFTSWQSIVPVTQRFAADHGWHLLGAPLWHCACCEGAAAWIPRIELLMLDVGLLASLHIGFRIAEANTASTRQAVRALVPWATVVVMLFLLGVWIVFQPMEMRGMLPLAGVN
jgi:hypothetical protein